MGRLDRPLGWSSPRGRGDLLDGSAGGVDRRSWTPLRLSGYFPGREE
jgi:hypothetical protein